MDSVESFNLDKIVFITHIWVVRIFLLLLIVKWVLLLIGQKNALESVRAKTKILDMILGTLVLATGLTLAFRSPVGVQPYIWIKLVGLLASIPLGIVGFRKKNIILATLSVLLIAGAMGLAYAKPKALRNDIVDPSSISVDTDDASEDTKAAIIAGKATYYERVCNTCHGDDGKMGFMGAKPLTQSKLTDEQMAEMIRKGKTPMPANPDISDADMKNLIAYIRNLPK